MPVYKDKRQSNKWYGRISFVDELGIRHRPETKRFDLRRDAVQAEKELWKKYGTKNVTKVTFDSIFNEYLRDQKKDVRANTYRSYEPRYAYIRPYLGKIEIKKLTVAQYKLFKDKLDKAKDSDGKPLSIERKNVIHSFVIRMIKYADKLYGISNSTPERVGGFKDPNKIKDEMLFYTRGEFKKFIEKCDDDMFKSFFITLYFNGLRLNEANGLTWNDVDFENETININHAVNTKIKGVKYVVTPPKTQSSYRIIPMEKHVSEALKKRLECFKRFEDFSNDWFVFGGICPIPESNITRYKTKVEQKAGVKHIRTHDFRHSCASLYIDLGANPLLISQLLGHKNVAITLNTYSHLYPSALNEVVSKVKMDIQI